MSSPPRWLIVVARDRLDLYERLAQAFDDGVEVVLDRRQEDRRRDDPSPAAGDRPEERRRSRRRQALPSTESAFAQHAGFFLVTEGSPSPPGPDPTSAASEAPSPHVLPMAVSRPEPPSETGGPPRVLVCDDDPLMRDTVVEALTGEFAVEAVPRAVETLQHIMRTRYDALLLDLRLPGLGGLAAVPVIKRLDARLPIIVMTGYGSYETEQAARGAGIFYYLPKPFSADELSDAVRSAVRAREREQRRLGETPPG
jgi:CheY-like chemotaxis protein